MNVKIYSVLAAGVLLAACASTPQPNAALESARAAVQAAETDPNVSKYAALDLEAAKKDLAVAEDAAQHGKVAEVTQPAYLATQNARLAQVHAATKADDARVAAGQAERDQIMLQARTRDARNAELAAARAKAEADNAKAEANAALSQRDAAQAELEALKAKPTPRGQVLTLGDVLFDTGQATLKPGAQRKLDQLAEFLNEHPDRRVQIDGFTDSVGTDSYNEDLSQRRADAVKSALLSRGISSTRIGTSGYGKQFPVASNTDSGGRQLNRRVEVVIGDDNGAAISPRT